MLAVSKFAVLAPASLFLTVSGLSAWQSAPATTALGLRKEQFVAKLLSPIDTKSSKKGDAVSALVTEPAKYQGATLVGTIQTAKRAHKRDTAEIGFAFDKLVVADKPHPVEADLEQVTNSKGVKGVDEEGRAIGKSSRKKQLAATGVGAALGAGIGALAGGDKHRGRNAAAGAAVGAGAGFLFAISFTTSGSDIEFAPGSVLTLVVSDPSRSQ